MCNILKCTGYNEKNMVRVLSFDIGTKNLAFCDLEVDKNGTKNDGPLLFEKKDDMEKNVSSITIYAWDVCDISSGKKHDIHVVAPNLLKLLEERFDASLEHVTDVVIENQPVMKNPIMKSIQMVMFTYFHMMKKMRYPDLNIHLISAANKTKVTRLLPKEQAEALTNQSATEAKNTKGYKFNKTLAQHLSKALLSFMTHPSFHTDATPWSEHYERHKKRDDLADAFLQGLQFLAS